MEYSLAAALACSVKVRELLQQGFNSRFIVHGDDFTFLVDDDLVDDIIQDMRKWYDIKLRGIWAAKTPKFGGVSGANPPKFRAPKAPRV